MTGLSQPWYLPFCQLFLGENPFGDPHMRDDEALRLLVVDETRAIVELDRRRVSTKNPDRQEIINQSLQSRISDFILLLLQECEDANYSPDELTLLVEENPIDYLHHPEHLALIAREALPMYVVRFLLKVHDVHWQVYPQNPGMEAFLARFQSGLMNI